MSNIFKARPFVDSPERWVGALLEISEMAKEIAGYGNYEVGTPELYAFESVVDPEALVAANHAMAAMISKLEDTVADWPIHQFDRDSMYRD